MTDEAGKTVLTEDAPKVVPVEEYEKLQKNYKSVQRELDKARKGSGDIERVNRKVDELYELMATYAESSAQEAGIKERFTEIKSKHSNEDKLRDLAYEYAEDIRMIMEGLESVDWNTDKRFESARTAWETGVTKADVTAMKRAVRETTAAAKKTLLEGASPDDVERKAEEKAQEILKKSGVRKTDTKDSSTSASTGKTWAQATKITKLSDLSDAEYEKLVA